MSVGIRTRDKIKVVLLAPVVGQLPEVDVHTIEGEVKEAGDSGLRIELTNGSLVFIPFTSINYILITEEALRGAKTF
jgi:hypothetical protein